MIKKNIGLEDFLYFLQDKKQIGIVFFNFNIVNVQKIKEEKSYEQIMAIGAKYREKIHQVDKFNI